MELKKYQTKVIEDFRKYLSFLSLSSIPKEAYNRYWLSRSVTNPDTYTERVPGCPYVSLKVPTAGGKTYLAVHALAEIFEDSIPNEARVVLWIVPWDTILTQTIKSLKDKDHPYRRRLDTQFGGKVEIYDKQSVLMGAGFSPESIKDQVSIIVLSMASFRRQNKEGLKSFQENGQLATFADHYRESDKRVGMIEGVDDTALAQVFNRLRPVMIIDESHRAEAPLSVETLVHLNPRFILGLTATPRKDANIVSFVNALDLKKEEMVKLPVIAKHVQNKDDVINQAIHLRNTLEEQAKLLEAKGGKYIRPIVLFQAESKNKDDVIDYDKIKTNLIAGGISEEQVAIKVANRDDLSGVDLLSKDCPIRYIITVNALKEGWDCPFACILASIANRTSITDVTQIIGRILRQPYAKRVDVSALNLSYVFSSSIDFAKTVDSIIAGLIEGGFDKSDVIKIDTINSIQSTDPILEELGHAVQTKFVEEGNVEDFTLSIGEAGNGAGTFEGSEITVLLEEAKKQDENLMKQAENNSQVDVPLEYQDRTAGYSIRPDIKSLVDSLVLPEFYIEEKMGLFGDKFRLGMAQLLEGFNLANSDSHIIFDSVDEEIFSIDVDSENHVRYKHTSPDLQKYILNYIDSLPQEEQLEYVVRIVCNEIGKRTELAAIEIFNYVKRILSGASTAQIEQIKSSPLGLAYQIRNKIITLEEAYTKKRFFELVDSGKLTTENIWKFPSKIFPLDLAPNLSGSLFEREGAMSEFERKMIEKISSLGNVTFWHRNESRKGFALNGWVNHYPDFIIMTESGRIILIETKGSHLDGNDSEEKIALGKAWAQLAGSQYRYFMVFSDENIIPGSYSINQVCDILKDL